MKHIAYNCIDVSEFSEGLAAIRTSDGVGFINTNGELVIPTVFEDIDWNTMLNTRYMFKEGLSAFVKGGKCGYMDKQGNTVISPEYDAASPFDQGIAAVAKDGKWGTIDKSGKTIIPMEYDFVQIPSEGVCGVCQKMHHGYIDQSGNTVIPLSDRYLLMLPFQCGVAVVEVGNLEVPPLEKKANESDRAYFERYHKEVIKVTQNNRYGAINKKGELTVELKYKYLSSFREGLAVATTIDGKQMYINTSGETVLEVPQDDLLFGNFSEGLAWVKSGKYGNFSEGLAWVKSGKYGCIDRSGNLVIPTEYDNTLAFKNKYAPVSKSAKWGLIDKSGALRLPIEYDSVSRVKDGCVVVQKGDTWSIIGVK